MLNIARFIPCTKAEGIGKRFCIWVQGCNLACPNCCNLALQPFIPRNLMPTQKLLELIAQSKKAHDIEGVTFLGGEPFLQAKGLSKLAKGIRQMGLSIICFSGFTHKEILDSHIKERAELLSYLDVLIDGRYIQEQKSSSRNLVGSSNQRFIYLTDRYDSSIESSSLTELEVRLTSDSIALFNGNPHLMSSLLTPH